MTNSKNSVVMWVVIAVVVVGVGWVILSGSGNLQGSNTVSDNMPEVANTVPGNGLQIVDETVGTGAEAKAGDTVTVDYIGTLTDGTKFDSSLDRGEPFSFVLGAGKVIQGWDMGVAGMKMGGKRKLTIPPELGYGAMGAGSVIPPNATLIFEVQLLDVKSGQ